MSTLKLQPLVKIATSSQEEYEANAQTIVDVVRQSSQAQAKDVITAVKKAIKDKHVDPPSKLRALELFDACMMTNNVNFLTFAQKKIMSRLTILGRHRKQSASPDRGEDIFGPMSTSSPENRDASKRFLVLLLNRIQAWALSFGRTPDGKLSAYLVSYNTLIKEGVPFPNPQNRSQSVTVPPLNDQAPHSSRHSVSHPQASQRKKEKSIAEFKTEVDSMLHFFSEVTQYPEDEKDTLDDVAKNLDRTRKEIANRINAAVNAGDDVGAEELFELNDRITSALDTYKQLKKGSDEEEEVDEDIVASRPLQGPAPGMSSSSSNSAMEKELQDLRNENKALRNALQLREQNSVDKSQLAKLQAEIAKLKKEKEEMRIQLVERDQQLQSINGSAQVRMNPEVQIRVNQEEAKSPKKGKEPDPYGSMSSSNSDSSEDEALVNNIEFYKKCNRKSKGILYENQDVQVGIQIMKTNDQVNGMIYIGNKSSEPISELITEIPDYSREGISINVMPVTSTAAIPQGSQDNRKLSAASTRATGTVPKMKVRMRQGHLKELSLNIPITLARFLECPEIPLDQVFAQWERVASTNREILIKLKNPRPLKKIAKDLAFNGVFTILSSKEVSTFTANQLFGVSQKDKLIFVMAEVDEAKSIVRLACRCETIELRNAIIQLLKEQLTEY